VSTAARRRVLKSSREQLGAETVENRDNKEVQKN
jgi:hypothetical protein